MELRQDQFLTGIQLSVGWGKFAEHKRRQLEYDKFYCKLTAGPVLVARHAVDFPVHFCVVFRQLDHERKHELYQRGQLYPDAQFVQ